MLKRLLTIAAFIIGLSASVSAQQKITKSDIENKRWKLVIDIKDEIDGEIEESDGFFERIVLKSVGGLVDNILDEIEIYFEFKENNELKIISYAFGERDVEYTTWRLDKNGALLIDSTENWKNKNNEKWHMVDDIIVAGDNYKADEAKVYLVSMEK
ncbi:MAG: hypothetical protein WBA74_03860 [Cyclobacteriaceae bacterium]